MSGSEIPAIIQCIVDRRRVETGEVVTLRRWFYGDGVVHETEADALFRVNAALAGRDDEFSRLFVEALTDFVVYQQMPTGRVTPEQAEWLIDRMGGPHARVETAAELDLLVNIMEEAQDVPSTLAAFALAQVRHAAITGEGPAAKGRIHFSRTVDAGDVALLERMLARTAGTGVSRAEAEVLFDIADACTGTANDARWEDLFARAIANHLLGAAGLEPRAAVPALDAPGVTWLQSRIHRDGRISAAEAALLAAVSVARPDAGSAARAAIVRMA